MTKKTPKGLHANRLSPTAGNPREIEFVKQWEKEHEFNDLLDGLFSVPCHADDQDRTGCDSLNGPVKRPLGEVTDRDRVVAATVFQWLGSNCGMSTIEEVLQRGGCRIAVKKVD